MIMIDDYDDGNRETKGVRCGRRRERSKRSTCRL